MEEELSRLLCNSYQIALHPLVLKELDHLILQASTNKKPLFRLAKQLALQYPILENILEDPNNFMNADNALLHYAQSPLPSEIQQRIIITNDRELRQRLRRQNIVVIFLRQQSHLELDGYLP